MAVNDRIFVLTSYMGDSAQVAWAAADSGIITPDDRGAGHGIAGELLIHMDGLATFRFSDGENGDEHVFVAVIDPKRSRNGAYLSVYGHEDQPPATEETLLWKSTAPGYNPAEHTAEAHERIEAETGRSCQHPTCLAAEVRP